MGTEYLKNGTEVVTGRRGFSAAGPLLAAFSRAKKDDSALDIGSGCGIILLWLYDRGCRGRMTALEKDAEQSELCRLNLERSGADAETLLCDARAFEPDIKYDLALCNPPFFSGGKLPEDCYRAAARHALTLGFGDAAASAARSLKSGGRYCVCCTPERLGDMLLAVSAAGFTPLRSRLCTHTAGARPFLALLEAVLGGDAGKAMLTMPALELDSAEGKEILRGKGNER